MNAIPERLRERAIRVMQELHTCLAPAHQECDSAEAAIAQALHEIAQAARIEGERRGIERAAALCDNDWRQEYPPDKNGNRIVTTLHSDPLRAAAIRALSTTAEPAKGA